MNNCIPFLDVLVIFANENKGKDMMLEKICGSGKCQKQLAYWEMQKLVFLLADNLYYQYFIEYFVFLKIVD